MTHQTKGEKRNRSQITLPFRSRCVYFISWVILLTVAACSSGQRKLEGIWHTEFEAVPNLRSAFDIEISHDLFKNTWSGRLEIPELMIEAPLPDVVIDHSKIKLDLGEGAVFEGNVSEDQTTIQGILRLPDRKPEKLHFLKTEKWSSQIPARVDKNKKYIDHWTYKSPQATDDGWAVGTIDKAASGSGPLKVLMQDILHGKYHGLDAMLVAQDGKLVLEEYFYLGGRERIHSIQSATKSLTSVLIGIAYDRGLIKDLDTPIRNFFPTYPDSAKAGSVSPSLRHALTMSAGLNWREDIPYTDPKNDAVLMNRSKDMYQYVLSKNPDPESKPGQKFEYNSGLSILLGGVILNATGKPADKYAQQTLFRDLGIKNFAWTAMNGKVHTGGGLYLRPRDLLKAGQLVLDKGKWNNKQIVSESWISESTAFKLPLGESSNDWGYGYQWWRGTFRVKQKSFPAIYASGYGGQFLYIIPDLKLVVVTLHHNPSDLTGSHTVKWAEVEKMILPGLM